MCETNKRMEKNYHLATQALSREPESAFANLNEVINSKEVCLLFISNSSLQIFSLTNGEVIFIECFASSTKFKKSFSTDS